MEELNELIDRALYGNVNVAKVVNAMYKNKYRYTSNGTLYVYNEDLERWVVSQHGNELRLCLTNEVCLKFMDRAQYWLNESIRNHDPEMRERLGERNKKLMNIAVKLNQVNYNKSIIEAYKYFFADDSVIEPAVV
jgi:hypothetical protein